MTEEYLKQADFVITINGQDVTKYAESWELNDTEEAISNLNVTIVNEDMKFSGKFECDQDVAIRYGYQGDLGEQVKMKIKEYTEAYSDRGCIITVMGMDCTTEIMTGNSIRGKFKTNDAQEVIKEIGDMSDCKVELGKMVSPKFPEGFTIQAYNERMDLLLKKLMSYCGNPAGKSGKGSTPGAGGKKAIKQQKGPKKGSGLFKGATEAGSKLATGPCTKESFQEFENHAKNLMENSERSAATKSVRASCELIGANKVRAKKSITIMNVGPKASGRWYVKGCTHRWNVNSGYYTRCDLIRADDSVQPNVTYADIYKEKTVYVGPRKVDEQQGTFTFGTGDKMVKRFKWTDRPQPARNAGEGGSTEGIVLDDAKQTEKAESKE